MTIDKEQLKALAEAATPGPWHAENDRHEGSINSDYRHIGMVSMFCRVREDAEQNFANQRFIAAANPATILALLDEIEQLSKNPVAQAVDAIATAAARHLASEAKGCVEKGLLETFNQLRAESEALRSQVAKLQAEPNSYQAGFDAGRAAEKAHAENWRAEAEGLRKDAARLTWLDESQEVDSVGPTLCCGKHRATLREAIDAAMAMGARHG